VPVCVARSGVQKPAHASGCLTHAFFFEQTQKIPALRLFLFFSEHKLTFFLVDDLKKYTQTITDNVLCSILLLHE